ncbi:HD-GYP domain-containing protein [Methylobacterium sp. J-068]|uniref:HD-GYP domain-containing protein n=1 Tax=Methylobacterium sp. J-068 TaxID=2836649 RepID=UPI001FBB68D1|nr:HD domain-containing phosphohydrolase [Methylobacterium sp. J-068]MCJ2036155.1 HD domain-containing protein [Methylobacterium sp. J-068]
MAREAGTALIVLVASATPLPLIEALSPLACASRLVIGLSDAPEALRGQACDLIVIDAGEGLQGETDDGIHLVAGLRAMPEHARTPILMLAGGDAAAVRRAAIAAGATDVIARPVEALDLTTRVGNLLELALVRRTAEQQTRRMARTVERAVAETAAHEREIIRRLMLAAEFRDDQAGGHLTRVAGCAIAIADGLGLSEQDANDVGLASTMHDIGKISIPDTILMKPGALSETEREEMKQHALRGYRMLYDSPSHLLQLASDIALTHHERWDGHGYPQGLRGTDIPLAGRIIAVADVFDALISERVYKKAWSPDEARRHLEAHSGSHFDPDCVAAFVSRWDDVLVLIAEHPPESRAA